MGMFFLKYYLDLAACVAVMLVAALAVTTVVRRRIGVWALNRRGWMIVALLLTAGGAAAVSAGDSERDRLKATVEGFAPTYAIEMQRFGHARVTFDTSADDATYIGLVEAEKRWLGVNRAVNDIYTFRKDASGRIRFVVDSETDYDHDGKYEGEREQRTAIGEVYDEATPAMLSSFDGAAVFDAEPYSDKWGTWVSAYVPILDSTGQVEAALGVDYDASDWVKAIVRRRAGVMAFTAVAVAIFLAAAGVVAVTKHEIERRRHTEASLRASEARVRAILDHEPEAVFVLDPAGIILECNPAAVALLEVADLEQSGATFESFVELPQRNDAKRWVERVSSGQAATLGLAVNAERSGRKLIDAHGVRLLTLEADHRVLVVARDVTAQKAAEAEREKLNQRLVDASRQAGMADIATGVLHNIGNVLNSVNMSNHVLADRVRQSKVPGLKKAAAMLAEHTADLGTFLTTDERGRQVPQYLGKLATLLETESQELLAELLRMNESLEHMKAIVHSQQAYAKSTAGVLEPVRAAALFEDSLKMNIVSCERHHVKVDRVFEELPPIVTDKHKVLQILINLIGNAKDSIKARGVKAVEAAEQFEGCISLRLRRGSESDRRPSVTFEVGDNGLGIAPENASRIFGMGFTTRKDGHGFGLHSAANYAKELGGSLTVASDGPNKGARFVLELPLAQHVAAEVNRE